MGWFYVPAVLIPNGKTGGILKRVPPGFYFMEERDVPHMIFKGDAL